MYLMCVCYCISVSAGVSAGALSVTHIHTSYMCCLQVYIYAHMCLFRRERVSSSRSWHPLLLGQAPCETTRW